jgi:hypothetical protein
MTKFEFVMLADTVNPRVHAVYDPYTAYPLALCGVNIVPDLYDYLPPDAILCRRCLVALPDSSTLRPGSAERRLLGKSSRRARRYRQWWRAQRYDRLIRRALAQEARRHG